MHVTVSGHHVEITPPLRDYVTSKVKRLERHFDHITNTQVTLTVEKLRHKAEASIHLSGGEVFAQSESADMYSSIDTLVDKLDRQIIRHKEKTEIRR
jgi:putative sigma-54 modulation protein